MNNAGAGINRRPRGLLSSSEEEKAEEEDDLSPSPAPASIPTSAAFIPSACEEQDADRMLVCGHTPIPRWSPQRRANEVVRRDVPRMSCSHLMCVSVGSPPPPPPLRGESENTASYSRCTSLRSPSMACCAGQPVTAGGPFYVTR